MILNLTFIFFLDCPLYSIERRTLLRSLVNIDHKLLDNTDVSLTQTLLSGNTVFNAKENTKIFNLTIEFVLSTKRFDGPLLWILFFFFSYPPNKDSSDNKTILSEASSHWILQHWVLFSMLWKSWIHFN